MPFLGLIFFVLLLSACGDDAQAPPSVAPAKPALTVVAVSPTLAQWAQRLAVSGNLAAWQETVVSSEIGGLRLKTLAAQVGDRVVKGQVLATLFDETVAADLAQSRAGLKEAEAMLAEAQANGDRARQFQGTGAISQQQIAQYLSAELAARARIDLAAARIDSNTLRLAQTRILAPDDAVVATRPATLGAVVQPGQELFRLILRGRLEWRAEVPSSELARIKGGAVVTLTLPGGQPLRGQVRVLAPAVDPVTRNGLVYVDLPASALARAGMFARGEIELGVQRTVSLPQSAVLLRDGFAYVFKIGDDRKVAQLKVSIGQRQGDRIEITSGLTTSDRVVESGVGFLGDGDTVEISTLAQAAGVAKP